MDLESQTNIEELKEQLHRIELSINKLIDERNKSIQFIFDNASKSRRKIQEDVKNNLDKVANLQKDKMKLENEWKRTLIQVCKVSGKYSSVDAVETERLNNNLDDLVDAVIRVNNAAMDIPIVDNAPESLGENETLSQFIDYDNLTWKQAMEYTNAIKEKDEGVLYSYQKLAKLAKDNYLKFYLNFLKAHSAISDVTMETKTGIKAKLKSLPKLGKVALTMFGSKAIALGKSSINKLKEKFKTISADETLKIKLGDKEIEVKNPDDLKQNINAIEDEIDKEYTEPLISEDINNFETEPIISEDVDTLEPDSITSEEIDAIDNEKAEEEIETIKPLKFNELDKESQEIIRQRHINEFNKNKDIDDSLVEKYDGQIAELEAERTGLVTEINALLNSSSSAFGPTEEETQKLDELRQKRTEIDEKIKGIQEKRANFAEHKRQSVINEYRQDATERRMTKDTRDELKQEINQKASLAEAEKQKQAEVAEAKDVLSHLKVGISNYGGNELNNAAPQYYNINGLTDDEILDTYNQIKASPDMASRLAEASEEAKKAKETAAFETNEVVTEEQISEPVKEEPEAEVPSAETQNVETDNVETQEVETPEVTYETPSVFAEPEKVEDTTPTVQNPETLTDEQLNQIINDAVTETIAYDNMQAQDNTLSPEMKQHYESVMQSFSNDPNSYEYQNAQAVLDQQAKADAEAAIESLHSRTR